MEVSLFPSQYKFLRTAEEISFFIAGIGTGKSFTLAHIILNHVVNFPKSNILLVANTYQQLVSATIPALTNLLDELGIIFKRSMGGAKKYLKINDVTIFLYSLEKYDNIRGIEVGLVAGDEIAYSKLEAFQVVMGRLRCKYGSLKARFVSSPNGFNWVYELINSKKAAMVQGATRENTFLPASYYKQLLDLYGGETSPLARQELFGEFVNITTNSVYFAFDRPRHVKPVLANQAAPVYVGLDFNVDNMNMTYCQYIDGKFKVFKERTLTGNNANTFDAAIQILQDLKAYKVFVVPDSTGKSRKTSAEAGKTDIQILKDVGLTVLETSNPRIKDRHNTVNRSFHTDSIEIDISCTGLIKDLETLNHKEIEGEKSHLAVTLGYVIWKLHPLKAPQSPSQTLSSPFTNRK